MITAIHWLAVFRTGLIFAAIGAFLILLTFCDGGRPAHAVELEGVYLEAGFAPPHNEPDVFRPSRGEVARYALDAGGALKLGERWSIWGRWREWLHQPWRTPEVVGSGLAAWWGSDYTVDGSASEYEAELAYRWRDNMTLRVEHRDGDRIPYYWLVKVRLDLVP